MRKYSLLCLMLLLAACTGGGETADGTGTGTGNGEHVWTEQVNTLNRAKGVEDVLGAASARRRQEIDEQMQ